MILLFPRAFRPIHFTILPWALSGCKSPFHFTLLSVTLNLIVVFRQLFPFHCLRLQFGLLGKMAQSTNPRVIHLLKELPPLPQQAESDYRADSVPAGITSLGDEESEDKVNSPTSFYDSRPTSGHGWTWFEDASHSSLEKLTDKADVALEKTIAPRPAGWRFFTSLAAVLSCAFLYGLDTTIAADVQASIYESLGEISKIAWIGIGFPLGSAGTILPISYAYGKFNLKVLFISGLLFFEGGSALCGAAPTMNALIVGRVIAGIGGCRFFNFSLPVSSPGLTSLQARSTLEVSTLSQHIQL